MVKFEDFLLFTESKSKEVVRRAMEAISEQPNKTITEELESLRNYELDNLRQNKLFNEFSQEEQEILINTINSIYFMTDEKEKKEMMNIKVEKFSKIAKEMSETYSRKNHDYGDSFGESVKKYGPIAGLVRMSDKWNRLNSLLLGEDAKVKEESIIDTLTDLACYSVMLRMELESQG